MCIESCESKYGALASSYILVIEVSSLWFTCFFLRFISNNAFVVLAIFNIIGLLSCVASLVIFYESPKWLVMKGRNKEAIDVINKIAQFNRSISHPLNSKTLIFIN